MFPWFLSRKTLRFNLGLQIGIAEGVLAPHRGKVGPHLLNTKNAGFHGTPFWVVYIHICMQIFMFAYIYHYIVHWYIFSYHIYTQMYNYHEYLFIYIYLCQDASMYILWFWIYIMRCLYVEPYLPKDSNQQTVPPAFEYLIPSKSLQT